MILGFIHRQNDFEVRPKDLNPGGWPAGRPSRPQFVCLQIEPRYNLATESVSCGVTYRVDDDNRLRAIFDQNTNMASANFLPSLLAAQ